MMPVVHEKYLADNSLNEDYTDPVSSLVDGLALSDLVNNHQTEFEIRPDESEEDNETYKSAESCIAYEEVAKVVNLDCINTENAEGGDALGVPFDKYRSKMSNITDDGKIKKYIVRNGTGRHVPDNTLVYVRYQAYIEFQEVPFDSTNWQQDGSQRVDPPVAINLSRGNVLPGMHQALLTMCRGEKAEFLVHPDLAYGPLGCPPRIPGDSTILFVIEVDRFVDCGDLIENEDLTIEEQREYKNVIKKARSLYALVTDDFCKENYTSAAKRCRIVIDMMHNARLANEQEEKERNHFLLKNYTTACICNKKLKKYKLVCCQAQDAMRVDSKEAWDKSKLQYAWGHAKMMLGDFVEAGRHLKRAQQILYPSKDCMVEEALKELEEKIKENQQKERMMAQRAFPGLQTPGAKIREISKDEEKLMSALSESLENFKSSSENILELKQTLTPAEEKIVQDIAKDMGLHARVMEGEHRRIIRVTKPRVQPQVYHPDLL